MKPTDDLRSSLSTLSAAPSLTTMSKPSSNNSKVSLANSRTPSVAESSKEPKPPTREEMIAELLEKAKFYTSLCLGR